MPGVTSDYGSSNKYDEIPGPLGLASASLQGKVALVTGAGKSESSRFTGVLDLVIQLVGGPGCATKRCLFVPDRWAVYPN
jgi:hypothetical protein